MRAKDDDKRLHYSLASTFLGRMCLSGDIYDLSDAQWKTVDEAIKLYKRCNHLISLGKNYRSGTQQKSFDKLTDWQAVTRVSLGQSQVMVIIHTFENFRGTLKLPLNQIKPGYSVSEIFARQQIKVKLSGNTLTVRGAQDFEGIVILLEN